MRLIGATHKTGPLAAISRLCHGAAHACRCFAADRRGSTASEYALTLVFVALGGTGITTAIGIEVNDFFQRIELSLCMQVQQFCVLN